MQSLVCSKNEIPKALAEEMFRDRKKQFVDRHGWDLFVSTNGQECDEYDDEKSSYLIVHDRGRHLGSCRVRPPRCSTMITDHFSTEFPTAGQFLGMQRNRVYELTRFCRSPDIDVSDSKIVLTEISLLMDRFRHEASITAYIAVVYPKVARFMDRIGMQYVLLSQSEIRGEPVMLICITEAGRTVRPIPMYRMLTSDLSGIRPLAA